MKNEVKLNFGSGTDIKEGYINIDLDKSMGADKICNMEKFPYPFKDNSADEINCYMVLEHIRTPTSAINEFHRIIKPGGVVKIVVPHCSHFSALLAELHICAFNTEYFFKRSSNANVWGKEIKTWNYIPQDKMWKDVKVTIMFPKGMLTILSWIPQRLFNMNRFMQQTYETLFSCFYRAHELHVELRNKK